MSVLEDHQVRKTMHMQAGGRREAFAATWVVRETQRAPNRVTTFACEIDALRYAVTRMVQSCGRHLAEVMLVPHGEDALTYRTTAERKPE